MFFGKFNKIQYNGKTVTDITSSILLKYRPMNNTTLYTFHTIADGESVITLADFYYGEPTAHWVILLLNGIVDPIFDWVLSTPELTAFAQNKYGATNINKVNYLYNTTTKKRVTQALTKDYVDTAGNITTPLPAEFQVVTNYAYEVTKNDKKRDIKILAPIYLQEFKNQFEDLIAGTS